MADLVDGFRPAWWLPGAHLQTLGARWLRSRLDLPLARERLELPDGDFVDLDFAYGLPDGQQQPLALILHGLEGSARSGYAMQSYQRLREERISAVGFNFRSCSGEPNRTLRFYHSGETGDLRHVIANLQERYPAKPLVAIGFSLGGNVLLKYLGETGDACPLKAAAAISVPFDLAAGAAHLRNGLRGLYANHLLDSLRGKVEARREKLNGKVDVARAMAASGFWEFDDAATAPLHGFEGADDYYRRSSSARYLHEIRVPTLLIHSADDPFLPSRCIPRDVARENPALVAAFTERGGHVGFVSGPPWRPRFWAETEAARFVARLLKDQGESPLS